MRKFYANWIVLNVLPLELYVQVLVVFMRMCKYFYVFTAWRDSIGHNIWVIFIFTSVGLVMCLMRSILSHEIDTVHRINSLYRTHPYINLPTEGSQSGFVKPGNSLRQMSHGTHQELNLQRKRENSPGYGTQAKSPFTIGVFVFLQTRNSPRWVKYSKTHLH